MFFGLIPLSFSHSGNDKPIYQSGCESYN